MIELLSDEKEHKRLLTAFEDIVAGRVRPLDEVETEMQMEK